MERRRMERRGRGGWRGGAGVDGEEGKGWMERRRMERRGRGGWRGGAGVDGEEGEREKEGGTAGPKIFGFLHAQELTFFNCSIRKAWPF
jgi:hypothetical protein